MEDKKYRLSGGMSLAVPVSDADKLISACNGTAALLYIYALRCGGGFSVKSAAAALKRTEAEVLKGMELLCSMGIFKSGEPELAVSLPPEELPEYTAEDIAMRSEENSEFRAIINETQRIMGHTLTSADLKKLFGIYDYLRLPAEVIFMLINHCVEETRERLGPGKLPSMHTIEKEAYVWYNREIITLERAEEYLLRKRTRSDAVSDVKRILQINGRNFTSSERKYVDNWLDMGFGLEAIALAYDKTVIKTGKLAWKYMDSILTNWHSKNLHTIEEIANGDFQTKSGTFSFGNAATAGDFPSPQKKSRDDAELMRKLLNQSKNN
ncbi:MAG: DnaD domain protein [Clostridiales bacterium]|nr:DnaD domain protein [Clostridiales bacterium]